MILLTFSLCLPLLVLFICRYNIQIYINGAEREHLCSLLNENVFVPFWTRTPVFPPERERLCSLLNENVCVPSWTRKSLFPPQFAKFENKFVAEMNPINLWLLEMVVSKRIQSLPPSFLMSNPERMNMIGHNGITDCIEL